MFAALEEKVSWNDTEPLQVLEQLNLLAAIVSIKPPSPARNTTLPPGSVLKLATQTLKTHSVNSLARVREPILLDGQFWLEGEATDSELWDAGHQFCLLFAADAGVFSNGDDRLRAGQYVCDIVRVPGRRLLRTQYSVVIRPGAGIEEEELPALSSEAATIAQGLFIRAVRNATSERVDCASSGCSVTFTSIWLEMKVDPRLEAAVSIMAMAGASGVTNEKFVKEFTETMDALTEAVALSMKPGQEVRLSADGLTTIFAKKRAANFDGGFSDEEGQGSVTLPAALFGQNDDRLLVAR